jgi:uncharacterized Zn-binding protein involved in type VI secretion
MSLIKNLGSGLIGASVLTAIHETARHTIPHAPRMDAMACGRSRAACGGRSDTAAPR